jgi:hypothetical protein
MGVSLVAHPSGDFTAVWMSEGQDGSEMGVFGQRFDSTGNQIGDEFRANTYTEGNQISPSLPKRASGDFVVVWSSYNQDGSDNGIFAQRLDASGNLLGTEFLVNTTTDSSQDEPSVAMIGTSGFVITWVGTDPSSSGREIFLQRFDANGIPDGGEYRVTADTQTNKHQPTVASDSAGNFVVIWHTDMHDGSVSEIVGQRFDSGSNPVGPELHINSPSDGDQTEADVTMDSTGRFAVAWKSYDQDGSGYGIFGRLFDSNGDPVTNEFQVNTHTESDQISPSVSMDESGGFIIAWASFGQDAGRDGIYGQKYNSNGQPLGVEFQINAPYFEYAIAPSVITAGQDRFITAWEARSPSTTGDIIGQRFNSLGEPRGRESW